ncbi:TOBE domain-containing protein [Arsenicicoccus dermatophilus]|uniref:TOBE domain-containing protein n=1 Tax=Arsenicicoccus dermatophilus TaxID=1076331 RepID=UPI001F4CB322|nr:TOBE domain-containing protein [Arsenicicoccus dermatophilus]
MSDQIRVRDAAALLGVSDDTVRRWVDQGQLAAGRDGSGRIVLDGVDLARVAREQSGELPDVLGVGSSARNRLVGLVTEVLVDGVMAEVTLQCGPFGIVSLMSRRSAESLGLEPGALAVAVVKATTVIVETPGGRS